MGRRSSYFAGLIFAAVSVAGVQSADDVVREDGVVVRALEAGDGAQAFEARTRVPTSMYTVLSVLADVENYDRWMPNVVQSRRVGTKEDRLLYLKSKGGLVSSDREVTLRSSIAPRDDDTFVLRFEDVDRPSRDDDAIRMNRLEGYYALRADGDGTIVTYRVTVDPGGMVPSGMAEDELRERTLDTLANLRSHSVEVEKHYAEHAKRWKARHAKWVKERDGK